MVFYQWIKRTSQSIVESIRVIMYLSGRMYPVKIPSIILPFAKDLLWKIDTTRNELYLTFDDGPTPGVTDKILDQLRAYQAHATFFCLGKNVEAYPHLYQRILAEGHVVGNHSYDHPDGWKTGTFRYAKNVLRADGLLRAPLFRPPYGRISPAQSALLRQRFRIVMYHIISGDFDTSLSPQQCLSNVIEHAQSGSIVVFHDSLKASANVHFALEGTLQHFSSLGFSFCSIH